MKKNSILLLSLSLSAFLLSGCLQFSNVHYADSSQDNYSLLEKDAYVFDDGTTASLWGIEGDDETASFRLSDGQELLYAGFDISTNTGGLSESKDKFEDMKETAQEAIVEYYKENEIPLDIPKLLKDAYRDYNLCQKEEKKFSPHIAEESIIPCIETERYIGFLKTVTIPASVRFDTYDETKNVVLFDRNTGSVIPAKDLFSVSEEEAVEVLANLFIQDLQNIDLEQLKSLIKLENLIWFQEGLQMHFPAESLTKPTKDSPNLSEEEIENIDTYIAETDYDNLKEILHSWAIPEI